MKNLQNHIFSTTTCISKETVLKFINKQLSQKELHDVQKHLIDCDFCSEALEGLAYAKNSSVLFNIDHKITTRTQQKTIPFARIILVAASVLFIAVGGYYTIDIFNDATQLKVNELSYQEPKKNITSTTIETLLPAQEEQIQEQKEGEEVKRAQIITLELKKNKEIAEDEADNRWEDNYGALEESPIEKQTNRDALEKQQDLRPTSTSSIGSTYKTELPKTELAESDDKLMDMESIVSQDKTVLKESTKRDENFEQKAKDQQPNKVVSVDNSKKSGEAKQRAKKSIEAPSPSTINDELKNMADNDAEELHIPKGNIQTENLEREAYNRNDNISTNETISFSEASGGLTAGSTSNSRSALTDGIADFNAKQYTKAIKNFDLILSETPTTTKTYEAKWYKALCLIELKDVIAAKKLLSELTYVNNPFSKKAEEKLKELE